MGCCFLLLFRSQGERMLLVKYWIIKASRWQPTSQKFQKIKVSHLHITKVLLQEKNTPITELCFKWIHTDIQEDEEEEVSTSLSVGDGRYLVDLGRWAHVNTCTWLLLLKLTCKLLFSDSLSPSEFIVDEKCILQLFKKCRECNRQCTVRKYSEGLKIVVNQTCTFCNLHCKWTNLPDDGEEEFQINGKDGQTNSAKQ